MAMPPPLLELDGPATSDVVVSKDERPLFRAVASEVVGKLRMVDDHRPESLLIDDVVDEHVN